MAALSDPTLVTFFIRPGPDAGHCGAPRCARDPR